ncbi:MAG: RimK/LysX family protein [Gammaproteobacteria bacterium]|nr:RimK/LysX family protein [Gammaproteobacteria bacterium]
MSQQKAIIGWREWVALPELGIRRIKAKVDTGARTSALHAFYLQRFTRDRRELVKFGVHPFQNRSDREIECVAEVLDEREVTDSGGHPEKRLVIKTPINIGMQQWSVELTLTDRDTMQFRMLLGRTAMDGRFIVDPSQSFLMGRPYRAVHSSRGR